jgi:hypothetical protein
MSDFLFRSADREVLVRRPCSKCRTFSIALVMREKTSHGHWMIRCQCQNCNLVSDPHISFGTLREFGKEVHELPLLDRGRTIHCCQVCGIEGASEHHFAPKCRFGLEESFKWPVGYLCQTHHRIWHQKMTPEIMHLWRPGNGSVPIGVTNIADRGAK